MRWYIIGRKAYYRTRCVLKIALIAVLLIAFSFSVAGVRYERELYASADSEAKSKLVIIDPGHGGEDPGAIGVTGVYEKDLNMQISLELAECLKQYGYTVLLTRTTDNLLYTEAENIKGLRKIYDLKNRCAIANEHTDAVFISIHMNSYSQEKYEGTQVYYSPSDSESAALAGKIQASVKSRLQSENNRQTKSGKGIYLLENTEALSVLVECGFITNENECKRLSDHQYQKDLALAITLGITEYTEGKTV